MQSRPHPIRRLASIRIFRTILAVMFAGQIHAARAQAADEEPISFTYSIHSTLGLLRIEATTDYTTETPKTTSIRVPNRGFSEMQRYRGFGGFAYRLLEGDDGGRAVSQFEVPEAWEGKHVYFFAFRGDEAGGQLIRLAPMPVNPDYRGKGAVVFGNYSRRAIAARLGGELVRAPAGETVWRAAPEAPDGMETLLVRIEEDQARPIYRNRIPIRSNQRVFIFITPSERGKGERLIVAYDRQASER